VTAAKWSINNPASRRAQPAVAGRGLSEGLGPFQPSSGANLKSLSDKFLLHVF
jgi:hypothetical protein